jgi:dTDP-4-amino-4,6-dideoxygalactose transaminase
LINVTKTFLPKLEEYVEILRRAWDKSWITNHGELALELEQKLKSYLGVRNLWFCNNGTIVLQMALKGLNISGEVLTTPFSYVATTSSLLWENCTPIFVDIDDRNFCIDVKKIEKAITAKTQAILATHVYGYPCDVEAIQSIAERRGIKVIYDAAHAFGTCIKGTSLFNYGDISTCSFHATKLFHTGEGGCIMTNDDELAQKLLLYRQFGHMGDEHFSMGINAKSSEMHAAMGLSILSHIDEIREIRKRQWLFYQSLLRDSELKLLEPDAQIEYNYAYFPIVFPTESSLKSSLSALSENNVLPRRYFFPALNTLPYLSYQPCPIAESIAKRVVCLPLFFDLKEEDQLMISDVILQQINHKR